MTELQDWRYVASTTIGTSHERAGTRCQDNHARHFFEDERVLVLIASDGAGSASRSDEGSALACAELLRNVEAYLHSGRRLGELTREVIFEWLGNIATRIDHIASEAEAPNREFACTLVAALISDTHAAFLQVGDGAIVVRPRGDDWCHVFWPQHGEYINTTVFLTDPSALLNFEFAAGPDLIDEAAVFTDGIEALVLHYASKTVHPQFFDGVFPPVRALAAGGYSQSLSEKLSSYLSSPAICDRTDDDKTLLLATRLKRPPSKALTVVEI